MRKVIGIVGEGPIDQMVLKAAINRITGESHIYRNIQPEQDMLGEFGNGWKGVYRWCETNAELIPALFSAISPALDLLIIQMDGDVARKEKEVHCRCESTRFALKRMRSLHWYADSLKKVIVLSSYLAGITLIPRRDIEYIWNNYCVLSLEILQVRKKS